MITMFTIRDVYLFSDIQIITLNKDIVVYLAIKALENPEEYYYPEVFNNLNILQAMVICLEIDEVIIENIANLFKNNSYKEL